MPFLPLVALCLAILVTAGLARSGAGAWLAARPLLTLGAGAAAGLGMQAAGLPGLPPDGVREAARLGLAFLGFAAAQQCRPSRLGTVCPPALRLAVIALPLVAVGAAAASFALLPGVGLRGAALIGTAFALGGGVFDEGAAMSAPLGDAVKRTIRLDAASALAFGIPVAVLVETAVVPPDPTVGVWRYAGFGLFAGTAVGGAIGLLAARLVRVRDASVPLAPLLAFAAAFAACRALGFDPVMGGVACGFLYSEEAGLLGPVRSRIFGAGLRWSAPPTLLAAGLMLGPVLVGADFLMLLAAGATVLVLAPVARGAALGATDLPDAARAFLSRFGGAPGVGAALFLLSLLASPALAAQSEALALGTLGLFGGVAIGRLASGPLVTRQVRAAARARKRRYAT